MTRNHPSLWPMSILGGLLCAASSFGQWYDQYQRLQDIEAKLAGFVATYPELTSDFTIGTSFEGRPIQGIKIGGTQSARDVQPAVLLNGTQHAREWISPMTTIYAAERLLSGYGHDPQITALLDQVEFHVIPVVNPDGYEYSWNVDRYWRKNRRPHGNGLYGVDLNRNWDYGWGLSPGSSSFPDSETYRGAAPFSEPETRAMRDYYLAHQNIVGNIDFHSYSQLILTPFGFSATQEPADGPLMHQLAVEMSSSISSVHGEYYDPISASDLYLASGISIDWTYAAQDVYSYTIELRPTGFAPGFTLPADEILPTAEEAFAAVLDMGRFTMRLAGGDFNDDARYDCQDLDGLTAAIRDGSGKYEFDVNGDGAITAADVDAWLIAAGRQSLPSQAAFLPGDADLNGVVDTSDFNIWNAHKFTGDASWCHGDFNVDGFVDASDFNVWNAHKFQLSGSALVAVPEPTAGWLGVLAIVTLAPQTRRRRAAYPRTPEDAR